MGLHSESTEWVWIGVSGIPGRAEGPRKWDLINVEDRKRQPGNRRAPYHKKR